MSSKSDRYTPEHNPLNPGPDWDSEQNEGGRRAEYSEPHFFDTRLGKRVKKTLGGLLGALAIALSVVYGDADASEGTSDRFVAAVDAADSKAALLARSARFPVAATRWE